METNEKHLDGDDVKVNSDKVSFQDNLNEQVNEKETEEMQSMQRKERATMLPRRDPGMGGQTSAYTE